SAPAASAAAFSDPAAAAPAFIPDVAGSYLLSVTVSDGRGHTSPPAFVAVTASGCATLSPVTGALTASAASLGNPVTLTAGAARAQACGLIAPVLTYAWSLSGKPAGSAAQ